MHSPQERLLEAACSCQAVPGLGELPGTQDTLAGYPLATLCLADAYMDYWDLGPTARIVPSCMAGKLIGIPVGIGYAMTICGPVGERTLRQIIGLQRLPRGDPMCPVLLSTCFLLPVPRVMLNVNSSPVGWTPHPDRGHQPSSQDDLVEDIPNHTHAHGLPTC